MLWFIRERTPLSCLSPLYGGAFWVGPVNESRDVQKVACLENFPVRLAKTVVVEFATLLYSNAT